MITRRSICIILLLFPLISGAQTWNGVGSGFTYGGPTGFYSSDKLWIGAYGSANYSLAGMEMTGFCFLDSNAIDTLPSGLWYGWANCAQWYNDDLIVGGEFSYAGSPPGVPFTVRIARWDSTLQTWNSITPLAGINNPPECMKVYNGDLYIGGRMNTVNGVACNRIAKWNGSTWSNVNGGVTGSIPEVSAMVEYHGWLYVGGDFYTVGSGNLPARGIARWNGTQWDSVGAGVGGWINALEVDTINDLLYAAGQFTFAGDSVAFGVAVWNDTIWRPVGSGLDTLWTTQDIEMFNGELYACGPTITVTTLGDTLRNIYKFNGTKWVSVDGGANGSVVMMEVFENNLYIGGAGFTEVGNGVPANHIACYGTTCPTSVGISEPPPAVPFTMYPNPNDGVLHIVSEEPEQLVFKLYNSTGQLVKEEKFFLRLDYSIESLAAGAYTVQISLQDGSRSHSESIIVK